MNATPAEQQAYALSKLLQDPSKPVFIPPPPSEGVRQLREPKDMMQNVQGSSAGAGSGASLSLSLSLSLLGEMVKLGADEFVWCCRRVSRVQTE
jgi:hypothetical protein